MSSVNIDTLERLFWTVAQFLGGVFLAYVTTGDPFSWHTFGYAVLIAFAKLAAARQVGGNSPQLMPGGTYEYTKGGEEVHAR